MNNIQINGQRRWGPPEKWSGDPPPHGTEVFIKNLPEEVFEMELYATFSRAGTVYEVRLPVNWNGLNRGYAFVRFTSVSEADRAILLFDGYQITTNRKIRVERSIDNTRLFLSAVPVHKNAEHLKRDLLNYVENVKKVYVYPTLENSSIFRGYAFVEFETHRDAAIAKRILTPDVCYALFDKKCIASWATPLPFLHHSLLNSVNVLFMRNIPKDINNFQLKKAMEHLTGGEEIKKVKIINNFAFLTYKNHKSAEQALHQLQKIPLLISNQETQVEWAIPKEIISSSYLAADKGRNGENVASEVPHPRYKGSKMDSSEIQRKTHFQKEEEFTNDFARISSSSRSVLNKKSFSKSTDIILSTQHEITPRVSRILHCESDVRSVPQRQLGGHRITAESLNSKMGASTVPTRTDADTGIMQKNICMDSKNQVDLFITSVAGFWDSSSDEMKCRSRSSRVPNIENVENSNCSRSNRSQDSKYHWQHDFLNSERSDLSPYSPLSPPVMTPLSSQPSVFTRFFPNENNLYPPGKRDPLSVKNGKVNDIIYTKSGYSGNFPSVHFTHY